MRYECYFCHIKTIEELINKFSPDHDSAEDFVFSVHKLLSENRKMPNPELAATIHRFAKSFFNTSNLYSEEKNRANKIIMDRYAYWKELVLQSDNPFYVAAKLAVIGNIIDYGAHSVHGDIAAQIEALVKQDLKTDKTNELWQELSKAKSVLYLGDNCGEIVFDKLFIETINHPNLTYVVRGKPVINDVTFEDALQVGMNDVCRVITNGYDAPSTLIESCSESFINEFNRADMIISKGQGNFEGLMDSVNQNIFFLLIAKCKPIAGLLNVNKKDMVIRRNGYRKS